MKADRHALHGTMKALVRKEAAPFARIDELTRPTEGAQGGQARDSLDFSLAGGCDWPFSSFFFSFFFFLFFCGFGLGLAFSTGERRKFKMWPSRLYMFL